MSYLTDVKDNIFSVTKESFDTLALEIFQFQSRNNPVYNKYINYIGIKPEGIKKVAEIPFLPIELFKKHRVLSGNPEFEIIFESSGTTGTDTSRHFVKDISIYNNSLLKGFKLFFGDPADYTFLALLPSYLERKNSSLTYMMQRLMNVGQNRGNGFYLYDHDQLYAQIKSLNATGSKIFLVGVSFALLDFAEKYQPDLSNAIVMETGGMKGRRKELIREELHQILKNAFKTDQIMSEYGMAELLSQAYSKKDGIFETPPWMELKFRDPNDPFSAVTEGHIGGINIIDLTNIFSCSFIATQDLGRTAGNGKFEILGRFDQSDIRGCSLMYE